jgi:hypothetical protein
MAELHCSHKGLSFLVSVKFGLFFGVIPFAPHFVSQIKEQNAIVVRERSFRRISRDKNVVFGLCPCEVLTRFITEVFELASNRDPKDTFTH